MEYPHTVGPGPHDTKFQSHSAATGPTSFSTNNLQKACCRFCGHPSSGPQRQLIPVFLSRPTTGDTKQPYFPIAADLLGYPVPTTSCSSTPQQALACHLCHALLMAQWSDFERRGIPLEERTYYIKQPATRHMQPHDENAVNTNPGSLPNLASPTPSAGGGSLKLASGHGNPHPIQHAAASENRPAILPSSARCQCGAMCLLDNVDANSRTFLCKSCEGKMALHPPAACSGLTNSSPSSEKQQKGQNSSLTEGNNNNISNSHRISSCALCQCTPRPSSERDECLFEINCDLVPEVLQIPGMALKVTAHNKLSVCRACHLNVKYQQEVLQAAGVPVGRRPYIWHRYICHQCHCYVDEQQAKTNDGHIATGHKTDTYHISQDTLLLCLKCSLLNYHDARMPKTSTDSDFLKTASGSKKLPAVAAVAPSQRHNNPVELPGVQSQSLCTPANNNNNNPPVTGSLSALPDLQQQQLAALMRAQLGVPQPTSVSSSSSSSAMSDLQQQQQLWQSLLSLQYQQEQAQQQQKQRQAAAQQQQMNLLKQQQQKEREKQEQQEQNQRAAFMLAAAMNGAPGGSLAPPMNPAVPSSLMPDPSVNPFLAAALAHMNPSSMFPSLSNPTCAPENPSAATLPSLFPPVPGVPNLAMFQQLMATMMGSGAGPVPPPPLPPSLLPLLAGGHTPVSTSSSSQPATNYLAHLQNLQAELQMKCEKQEQQNQQQRAALLLAAATGLNGASQSPSSFLPDPSGGIDPFLAAAMSHLHSQQQNSPVSGAFLHHSMSNTSPAAAPSGTTGAPGSSIFQQLMAAMMSGANGAGVGLHMPSSLPTPNGRTTPGRPVISSSPRVNTALPSHFANQQMSNPSSLSVNTDSAICNMGDKFHTQNGPPFTMGTTAGSNLFRGTASVGSAFMPPNLRGKAGSPVPSHNNNNNHAAPPPPPPPSRSTVKTPQHNSTSTRGNSQRSGSSSGRNSSRTRTPHTRDPNGVTPLTLNSPRTESPCMASTMMMMGGYLPPGMTSSVPSALLPPPGHGPIGVEISGASPSRPLKSDVGGEDTSHSLHGTAQVLDLSHKNVAAAAVPAVVAAPTSASLSLSMQQTDVVDEHFRRSLMTADLVNQEHSGTQNATTDVVLPPPPSPSPPPAVGHDMSIHGLAEQDILNQSHTRSVLGVEPQLLSHLEESEKDFSTRLKRLASSPLQESEFNCSTESIEKRARLVIDESVGMDEVDPEGACELRIVEQSSPPELDSCHTLEEDAEETSSSPPPVTSSSSIGAQEHPSSSSNDCEKEQGQ